MKIMAQVAHAYKEHIDAIVRNAEECIDVTQYNANNVPELGTKEYQIEQALAHLDSLKDVQGLDEVQYNMLRQHTDGDICDLECYDETCDLRCAYQFALECEIDDIIYQLKNQGV